MDLRDLWRPGGGVSRLTYRRLRVLIDHFPPESATKTSLRDSMTPQQLARLPEPEGDGQWSHLETLMAAIIDQLGWVRFDIVAAQNGPKGLKKPEPWPRPGVKRRASPLVQVVNKDRKVAYLSAIRDRHEQQRLAAQAPKNTEQG